MKRKLIFISIACCFFLFSGLLILLVSAGTAYEVASAAAAYAENNDVESLADMAGYEDGAAEAGAVKGKRTSYPSRNNKFFFNPSYNAFAGTRFGPPATSHNCTWYAFGRFSEILGKRAALPTGNAGTWYESCSAYKKGRTPKVGAVVVWRYAGGGAGHVAVVEEIKSNGDILTSNSGWSGPNFWMQTWTKRSGYQGGKFVLQGFIYQPN